MNAEYEIQEKLKSLEGRVKKLEKALFLSPNVKGVINKNKKTSPREFLMTKALKSESHKALALGYFLEHIEGMESFNVDDLEKVFRDAKEKPPKNLNLAVHQCNKHGFMMEAADKKDSKKAWCLTSTGETYLESELNKQGA